MTALDLQPRLVRLMAGCQFAIRFAADLARSHGPRSAPALLQHLPAESPDTNDQDLEQINKDPPMRAKNSVTGIRVSGVPGRQP